MVGQVLGAVGALPNIFTELEINYFLLRRLLGVKTEGDKKGAKVYFRLYFVIFLKKSFTQKRTFLTKIYLCEKQMNG